MMRTVMLALACVLVAAPPAMAKKKHARPHAAKAKKQKRGHALVHVQKLSPTRVAAAEAHPTRAEPTPPPAPSAAPAPSPTPTPPPSPPVEHGPMGPQATDDEVPGSRMKR